MEYTQIVGQKSTIQILNNAVVQDLPVLMIGETGTGKTEMVKMLAKQLGKTLIRYNINGETTADEIVGRYELINGETRWIDGIVVQAMKSGDWLLMDEVNLALPEVIMILQALLDDSKEIRIAQHHGEVVRPADGFRFFATMNPTEGYSGTKPLNRAFLSRYPIVLNIQYPEREDEIKILKKHGLKEEEAQTVLDVAVMTRQLKQMGEMNYHISTRELIQYANLRQFMKDQNECMELAIINKAQGEDRVRIKQIVDEITTDYEQVKKDMGMVPTIKYLKDELKKLDLMKRDLQLERQKIKEEVARELVESINAEGRAVNGNE